MQKIDFAKVRLAIVDFDGPLHDLTSSKIAAAKSLCKKLGIKLSKTALFYLLNYIEQIYESRKIIDYEKILSITVDKLRKQGLIKLNIKQKRYLVKNFATYLVRHQIIDQKLVDFIKKVKSRNRNLSFCIYSSQEISYIENFMNRFNIDPGIFDRIYGKDSFDEPKPSIKSLTKICQDFRIAYQDTVIIGDNVAALPAPRK